MVRIITETAQNGTGQIHIYGWNRDELINLDFASITRFSHGHHVRGGGGENELNFTNISNVRSTVVGRIEDFDMSRDTISIDGTPLDFNNLPGNVRIVEYNGMHNDPGANPQQWLLIDTGPGYIFYALEGARIDMQGNSRSHNPEQENHFLASNWVPNFATLQDVTYQDPVDWAPDWAIPDGGIVIDDVDGNIADVNRKIVGTANGDVIAAGLNDDDVDAGGGNDQVWGGSGHEKVYGGDGNDTIYGGTGNDSLTGRRGNDTVYGGDHNDTLNGWGGNDRLYGEDGNDRIYAQQGNDILNGGNGNDRLFGSSGNDNLRGGNGNDHINGGTGRDIMRGDGGADRFEFKNGDLMDWDQISGNWTAKNNGLDKITDFQIGTDVIEFDNYATVDSMSDLRAWKTTLDGNMYFTVQVRDTNERVLVDVADNTSWSQFFNANNFDII